MKEANRAKSNDAPHEAAQKGVLDWDAIEANLKNLPENKRWRFGPDAMARFEGDNDFLDRALVDTQYLAKISRMYLDTLFTRGGHVWVVPGRMTEMLRRHWGLNSLLSDKARGAVKAKNRTDHRHHAIDAAVVAATDYGLVQKISRAAGLGEHAGQSAELIARDTPEPWEHFRTDIAAQLDKIIVSHRADHGRIDVEGRKTGRDSTAGQLHQATVYSIVNDTQVAARTDLLSVKPAQLMEKAGKSGQVRDPYLRNALFVDTKNKTGKDYETALRNFVAKDGPYQGMRRVRITITLQDQARVPVPHDAPIKAYQGGSNHKYEIWRLPNGKYVAQVISTYEAHTGVEKRPHPAAKKIARFSKMDMVRVEDSKFGAVTATVAKFDGNGKIELVPHNEANASDRYKKIKEDLYIRLSATTAVKSGLRRVHVDEIGRLRDPGPPTF
ncbi:MAG: hypothetical protein N4A53_02430 [Pelagimonas sp.]|nr:hypothetical protein [Pelagimonas sp.]